MDSAAAGVARNLSASEAAAEAHTAHPHAAAEAHRAAHAHAAAHHHATAAAAHHHAAATAIHHHAATAIHHRATVHHAAAIHHRATVQAGAARREAVRAVVTRGLVELGLVELGLVERARRDGGRAAVAQAVVLVDQGLVMAAGDLVAAAAGTLVAAGIAAVATGRLAGIAAVATGCLAGIAAVATGRLAGIAAVATGCLAGVVARRILAAVVGIRPTVPAARRNVDGRRGDDDRRGDDRVDDGRGRIVDRDRAATGTNGAARATGTAGTVAAARAVGAVRSVAGIVRRRVGATDARGAVVRLAARAGAGRREGVRRVADRAGAGALDQAVGGTGEVACRIAGEEVLVGRDRVDGDGLVPGNHLQAAIDDRAHGRRQRLRRVERQVRLIGLDLILADDDVVGVARAAPLEILLPRLDRAHFGMGRRRLQGIGRRRPRAGIGEEGKFAGERRAFPRGLLAAGGVVDGKADALERLLDRQPHLRADLEQRRGERAVVAVAVRRLGAGCRRVGDERARRRVDDGEAAGGGLVDMRERVVVG